MEIQTCALGKHSCLNNVNDGYCAEGTGYCQFKVIVGEAKQEEPKLCKTCEFWALNKASEQAYGMPSSFRKIGNCSNDLVTGDAIHHGCAPNYQLLFTEDFGCIHHKQKEVTE